MPSDSSESPTARPPRPPDPADGNRSHRPPRRPADRSRIRTLPLVAAVMLPVLAAPLAASASPAPGHQRSWGRGVFPVVSFAGFTSRFGLRHHPLSGVLRPHDGLDIAAPLGSPVLSWWGGRVLEVIADRGCGNGLVIRSGDYEHLYCHLAGHAAAGLYRSGPVLLAVGDRVAAGQTIGHVGISGASTGPHLHWGLRHRGRWLDPVLVLRAMAASRNMARSSPQRRFNVGLLPRS